VSEKQWIVDRENTKHQVSGARGQSSGGISPYSGVKPPLRPKGAALATVLLLVLKVQDRSDRLQVTGNRL
jgi:hypothetical protein